MNPITLWQKIPLAWREELVSASHTFFGALIAAVLFQLSQNGGVIPTTQEAVVAIAIAAVRSAWKALVMFLAAQVKSNGN